MADVGKQLELLRKPFSQDDINVIPKPYKNAGKPEFCSTCGGRHGLPAAHLSYVGHAALTNRLLEVDPMWNWEPVATDVNGLPLIVNGGMWIRLTVCGVTRLGYGDCMLKTGHNAIKETIGDALRNAGMRFGCALDMWHKGDKPFDIDIELEEIAPQITSTENKSKQEKPANTPPQKKKEEPTKEKATVEAIKGYIDAFCKPQDGNFFPPKSLTDGFDKHVKPILGKYTDLEQTDIVSCRDDVMSFLIEKEGRNAENTEN